jgi:hypothetical protein
MRTEGIFLEKLPVGMTEKKKGIKKTRYIIPMDIHIKISRSERTPPRLKRKKARRTIPAPKRKRINLKNDDKILVIFYSLIDLIDFISAAWAEFYS